MLMANTGSDTHMKTMLAITAAGLLCTAHAETISSGKYTVVSVQEGDLFTVKDGASDKELRLYGIDAPEQGQPYFEEARAYVERHLKDKEVALDSVTADEDGHPVVVVRIPEGGVLHERMVEEGFAWWDSINVPENATLKRLNATAIGSGAGLFQDAAALTPWDFRKSQNLKPVLYLRQTETEAAPAEEAKKEEPKVLKAKGDGAPAGDPAYMKAEARTAPGPTTAPAPALPAGALAGIDTGGVDVLGLVARHQPRVATDATGNPVGFTADNISQIPMASQLGFRDGDVITAVNGNPIRSEFDALGLVQSLKGVKSLNVNILRNGQPTTLNINVP